MTDNIDYQKILNEIYNECLPYSNEGQVASYIPELAKVSPDNFGISLIPVEGGIYSMGNVGEKFSIQSISKVLSLTMALSIEGESIWKRVGVEPSGDPFNSLIQLEHENGIPRNPFINAGAIVITDILYSALNNPKEDFLSFIHNVSGIDTIGYNKAVAKSEYETGARNMALANFLKSYDNLHNEVFDVLDFYCHICALEMTCEELAKTFLLFAQHGMSFPTDKFTISKSMIKRVNAIMQTCGFYDESGQFAFKVGLPGKSGVGGGIVAVYPLKYSIAVWSPLLNPKGNSIRGIKTLELLTSKSNMSIF